MQIRTRGGESDAEVKELIVSPQRPPSYLVVTTRTGWGRFRMKARSICPFDNGRLPLSSPGFFSVILFPHLSFPLLFPPLSHYSYSCISKNFPSSFSISGETSSFRKREGVFPFIGAREGIRNARSWESHGVRSVRF